MHLGVLWGAVPKCGGLFSLRSLCCGKEGPTPAYRAFISIPRPLTPQISCTRKACSQQHRPVTRRNQSPVSFFVPFPRRSRYPPVAEEIRKVLGRNTIVHNGLSVGVAWTSVCISHEPPDRSKEEEQASAAAAVEAAGANEKGDTRKMPETLTVPETEKHLDDHAPESPGSIDTAAVTVATGHPAAGRQKLKQRPGYDNRSPNQTSKRLAEDKESRKKKIKGRERRAGGEGSDGDGTGRSGGSGGSGGEKTGGRVRRQRQQRRDQRRPKSIGAFSPREERARRGRGRGKHRGSTSDRSSGEEVGPCAPFVRPVRKSCFLCIRDGHAPACSSSSTTKIRHQLAS